MQLAQRLSRASFRPPQRPLRGRAAHSEGEAKTTTAYSTKRLAFRVSADFDRQEKKRLLSEVVQKISELLM